MVKERIKGNERTRLGKIPSCRNPPGTLRLAHHETRRKIRGPGVVANELPQAQIAQFFENADTMLLNANLGKYERAFTRFVCNLFCFKIQVFDKTRPTRLWNALDEPFAAFAARVKKLDFQISEVPYPPSEVIISWLELQG